MTRTTYISNYAPALLTIVLIVKRKNKEMNKLLN